MDNESPISMDRLVSWISESGLWSSGDLRELDQKLAQLPESEEAASLVSELVRQGKLTSYQADRILTGNTDSLLLGNYTLIEKIGQGGMGEVFRAYHRRMDRVVALKILPDWAVDSRAAVQRFEREVRTAGLLNHPNIVTAFDADEADGIHFLVMEYVPGSDLGRYITENGPLSVEQTIDCVLQAAHGIDYAHSKGVIHRDIKPSNILMDPDGAVKILDMGLVRTDVVPGENSSDVTKSELTQTGAMMGSFDYMAPEQAEDTHHASQQADVYSLGCTMFYLLTGASVYSGETPLKRIIAHREHPIPSVRRVRADVPRELDFALRRMIAKRPADRFPSMQTVITELARFKRDEPATVKSPDAPVQTVPSKSRKMLHFLATEVVVGTVEAIYTYDQQSGNWLTTHSVAEVSIQNTELSETLGDSGLVYAKYWTKRWQGDGPAPEHDPGLTELPRPQDRIRAYLKRRKDGGYDTILPNGIEKIGQGA